MMEPTKDIHEQSITDSNNKAVYFLVFLILGGLISLFTIGGYVAVKISKFTKMVANEEYVEEPAPVMSTNEALEQSPSPVEVVKEPEQAETYDIPVIPKAKPACQNRYTIREGPFTSDKCYPIDSYNDLVYYISKYNDAVFAYNGAENKANVTCKGFSEQFENLCNEAEEEMDKAENDKEEYADIIKDILTEGTSFSKY